MGSVAPVNAEPCAVLGHVAALLAEGRPLQEALHALASGLDARSIVVRSASGELLGVGGEALHIMRAVTPDDTGLEIPVPGPQGATLTVRGARPSQLPVLRAAAAVLGLHLVAKVDGAALVSDRELELQELADALHDGPMQSLMVARYAADAALRGGDLEASRAAIQAGVVELRQLVWALRPRGAVGLGQALEELASDRVKAGSAPLELDLPAMGLDLDAAAAVLTFRLVQASAPTQVQVRLQPEGIWVDINSGLPSAERWARRAEALGCRLTAAADSCTLLLPRATSSFSTDVRTTS